MKLIINLVENVKKWKELDSLFILSISLDFVEYSLEFLRDLDDNILSGDYEIGSDYVDLFKRVFLSIRMDTNEMKSFLDDFVKFCVYNFSFNLVSNADLKRINDYQSFEEKNDEVKEFKEKMKKVN